MLLSSIGRRNVAIVAGRPPFAPRALPVQRPLISPWSRLAYKTMSSSSPTTPPQAGDAPQHGPASAAGEKRPPPPEKEAKPSLLSKMVESAATTFASIMVLAVGFSIAGYVYHRSYKRWVLQKMTHAFEPGDPVLDIAAIGKNIPLSESAAATHWVERPEQAAVDSIVAGYDVGHYYLIIGEKGTGKSSMLLEAMRKIDGYGIAMFEAHADLEVVRIRLGKALDFEFAEDRLTYFSERGLRDTTALLDIERALNKLEKVALERRAKVGRPLVLIINQMHLVRDDEDGKDLFELLQQRAEQWAAAHLVTMIFNSDDYWVYERLKQLATRMEVISVADLPKAHATAALQKYRERYFEEKIPPSLANEVYNRVGGRLTFLNQVAKSKDMLSTCDRILDVEKKWFLNQCWILGEEMDDDVMDQQKFAVSNDPTNQAQFYKRRGADFFSSSFLFHFRFAIWTRRYEADTLSQAAAVVLATALVDKEAEAEQPVDPGDGLALPSYPMHIAQEIMTRADFIRTFDRLNLFTITSGADVRASSVPMHLAFREIVAQPGFRKHLQATIDRIAAIESLGRTRELVAKDLVLGAKYQIRPSGKGFEVTMIEPPEKDDD